MALLTDLIWTCGQHALFRNVFDCFCLHLCVCTNQNNLYCYLFWNTQLILDDMYVLILNINEASKQPKQSAGHKTRFSLARLLGTYAIPLAPSKLVIKFWLENHIL